MTTSLRRLTASDTPFNVALPSEAPVTERTLRCWRCNRLLAITTGFAGCLKVHCQRCKAFNQFESA